MLSATMRKAKNRMYDPTWAPGSVRTLAAMTNAKAQYNAAAIKFPTGEMR